MWKWKIIIQRLFFFFFKLYASSKSAGLSTPISCKHATGHTCKDRTVGALQVTQLYILWLLACLALLIKKKSCAKINSICFFCLKGQQESLQTLSWMTQNSCECFDSRNRTTTKNKNRLQIFVSDSLIIPALNVNGMSSEKYNMQKSDTYETRIKPPVAV